MVLSLGWQYFRPFCVPLVTSLAMVNFLASSNLNKGVGMPRKITEQQKRLYMESRKKGDALPTAAAKAGFCERTAFRIEKGSHIKQHRPRQVSTKDPFTAVWANELIPLLERDPLITPITLLRYLQERYPTEYPDKHLRTLQRKVRDWKALHGKEKERIFRQEHPPGFQGISDFTNCDNLQVTIKGSPLPHLLYHFRMPFSGWAYAHVVLGGESYSALSEGFQNALWQLGGAPETHRTDSLSAAFKNLQKNVQEDMTKAYNEMLASYGIRATRNNRGVSHENGGIEGPHRHLKQKIDQKLRLRSSRDFESLEEYRCFVYEIVDADNARCRQRLAEERKYLKPLPRQKARVGEVESVRVPTTGIINVRQALYAVPSRLIGYTLTVHIYDDRLECFYGTSHIVSFPRLRWNKGRRPRNINYRFVIPELVRKPQAFRHYVFRDDLFPSEEFRQAWKVLDARHDNRTACKEMVQILKLAAEGFEQQIAEEFRRSLPEQNVPSVEELQRLFKKPKLTIPMLELEQHNLGSYDELLNQVTS